MSLLIEVSEFELWFKKNQRLVRYALMTIIMVSGFYMLHSYQNRARLTEASTILAAAEAGLEKKDAIALQGAAEHLKNHYAATHQASLAMLQLARFQAEQQQWKESEVSIRWVIEHAPLPIFADQARIQLAQLQIQGKQWDSALATLKDPFSEEAFNPTVTELIADIFAIKGDITYARLHYQKAINAQPQGHPYRELIQYKLDTLAP